MNLQDAYQFLGLGFDSTESERFAAYEAIRAKLEGKLAKAPTTGLREKYQAALAQLDEAIEAVEDSLDGRDLPILRRDPADDAAARSAAPQASGPRSHPRTIGNSSPPGTSELVVVPTSILTKVICWPLCLFCLAVAGRLIYTAFAGDAGDGFFGPLVGGIVVGFVGLVFAGMTMADKKSVCPECGHTFGNVMDDLTRCPDCLAYLRRSETALTTVGDDEILEKPTFKARLPEQFTWPHACCVCRAEPSRMLEFNFEKSGTGRNLLIGAAGLAAGSLIVSRGGHAAASIEAPYCDRCEDGIALEKDGSEFQTLFRSYGYYRDFCVINQLSSFAPGNRSS